jgi:hypothetical protein
MEKYFFALVSAWFAFMSGQAQNPILFSDFNGHLFLLEKSGGYPEILNTITVQTNLADFEWIPDKKMLIIPGLYSNRLGAYKLLEKAH